MAGLSTCRTLKEPDYQGIRNVTIQKIGSEETYLSLEMKYYNPNKVKLKFKKAAGKAYLNDSYLGNFRVDTLIHLFREQDFIIPVTLTVDMKNMMNYSMATLLQSTVTIKFEGNVKLGKGLFYFNYPIRQSGEFNLKELLR